MIGSIALVILGAAAAAATPCENLASLKLADATITSAVVVPEGRRLNAEQVQVGHEEAPPAHEAVRLRRISRLIAGFRWFSSPRRIP